ncbi:MAG: dTMP kinase [Gammaproteobacteria bacterium]
MAARLITLEGIEGVGKSTCLTYIQQSLQDAQIHYMTTREPGGTQIAESIRQILLHHEGEEITDEAELLLMFAARSQHIQHVIRPALESGKWVICDRFTDASYAYQGGGRGIFESQIANLENWIQGDLRPDLTIILDAPVSIALERAKGRSAPDRIEESGLAFFERARAVYLARAKAYPDRYRVIDATQGLAMVKEEVQKIVLKFLPTSE